MEFKSIDPYTGSIIATHQAHTPAEVQQILENAGSAFEDWRKIPFAQRAQYMTSLALVLRTNVEEYASTITLEMGKPINESRAEVLKCAWVCEYYALNAEDFLRPETIETDAQLSLVRHDPIGCVFAIMPWNFPFWQVFRFAAPTLMAGNTAVLKHASNVFGCAKLIEQAFFDAGFPDGVFQNLFVHHDRTESIIAHSAIGAVTITGSEKAGSAVASIAGRHIKRSLLELGGSNAFIVWPDADIDQAVETALMARMLNCGQSCIAAKRFILIDSIYDAFVSRFSERMSSLRVGDPKLGTTQVGPLARLDLADELQNQVKHSLAQGAELLLGGTQNGCFHQPTVLGNVMPQMAAFSEETFGPLAAMVRATDIDDAFRLSELSPFGLGVTVCTKNIEKAISMADRVSDGAYFINELVKSDPRLPFGGTKRSGYGRELAKDGILEFVNRKTVYVK